MRSVLEPTVPIDVGALSQRQRIIDAMIGSCAEKSYAGTTIADIVSRASISRTTFYKRFEGKRECFDAALDSCLDELRGAAAAAHTADDPPAAAVRKATAAMLDLMTGKPALTQLVIGEAVSVEPAVVDRYRKLLIPALEALWKEDGSGGEAHTDPRLAFGRAQVLIYNQVLAGKTAQLANLLPELVYLALLPFVGHERALTEARQTGDEPSQHGDR